MQAFKWFAYPFKKIYIAKTFKWFAYPFKEICIFLTLLQNCFNDLLMRLKRKPVAV